MKKQPFSFWLPNGLTLDKNTFARQIHKCQVWFNQIKQEFHKSKNILMDKLWLEVEQVGFFHLKRIQACLLV